MYKVYTLICPISNYVVYVGMTKAKLRDRLNGHVNSYSNNRKVIWHNELKEKGLRPKIKAIAYCSSENSAKNKENYYIDLFLRSGKKLFNNSYNGFVKNPIIPKEKLTKFDKYVKFDNIVPVKSIKEIMLNKSCI